MRANIVVSIVPAALALLDGASPLSDLNECIQHRFLDTRAFGINRILPMHGVIQFRPENAKERSAIEGLQQNGYDVALFLAGRKILDSSEAKTIDPRTGLQGPAYITGPSGLPKMDFLLPDARAALASFDRSDGSQTQKDGWTVTMRPLRATSETCVQCHTRGTGGTNANIKVGDALGVVVYVYRQTQPTS